MVKKFVSTVPEHMVIGIRNNGKQYYMPSLSSTFEDEIRKSMEYCCKCSTTTESEKQKNMFELCFINKSGNSRPYLLMKTTEKNNAYFCNLWCPSPRLDFIYHNYWLNAYFKQEHFHYF